MARIQGVQKGGLLARLTFFISRLKYGKVVTPLRLHARSTPVLWGMGQMQAGELLAGALSRELKLLAQLRVAWRVGCPF